MLKDQQKSKKGHDRKFVRSHCSM